MVDTERLKIRKKRLRKAPTLREQVEAAKAEDKAVKKPGRIRRGLAKVSAFFRKTRITHNPLVKLLARIGRIILKVLRFLVPKYLINSFREVRLVTWPSRRETWRLTFAVFAFAIVFGAVVAGVDKGLDVIFKKVVLKQ